MAIHDLINRNNLAESLGISSSTLGRWARLGCGPVFVRVGKKPMYKEEDVENWINKHRCHNTASGILGMVLNRSWLALTRN